MQFANNREHPDTAFQPLLEMTFDAAAFSADWSHCDRIATYVARMVGHDRADSLLYTNLFSSAFNELLETAFHFHRAGGELGCAVLRAGSVDRIELSIPCDEPLRAFYADAVESLSSADVAECYVQAMLVADTLDPRIGLMELVVDYQARMSLQSDDGDSLRLIADLVFEESAPEQQ